MGMFEKKIDQVCDYCGEKYHDYPPVLDDPCYCQTCKVRRAREFHSSTDIISRENSHVEDGKIYQKPRLMPEDEIEW